MCALCRFPSALSLTLFLSLFLSGRRVMEKRIDERNNANMDVFRSQLSFWSGFEARGVGKEHAATATTTTMP